MKPLARKILKIIGIMVGILLLLLTVAYWWFVRHAESIICDIVRIKSKGTVELQLKSVAYNFSNHRLNLRGAVFYNTDSATTRTSYEVRVKKVSLQLHSLLPLVLNSELSIDSILINQPDIRVTKLDTSLKRDGSLTLEIGQFYNSIHKGLSVFSVGYFRIEQGTFTLANRARTSWKPVTLSNIYFHINNFEVNGVRPEDDGKFFFSNNIIFQTHHQQLTFPDGRYDMSFSHFSINVKNKVIEMDSCTFATAGFQQPKTAIRLYFDKLKFTGIDLDALYYTNTLKADSMYALNPVAKLRVEVDSLSNKGNEPGGIDSLLRQLGMNLQIKYMGVKNISTSLVTVKDAQSSAFHTEQDDFELHDIRVNQHAAEPVSIGGFNMAIRGYSSLNKDSSYFFRFDSVRFINSKVLLNNFSITSAAKASVQRHHELPLFELDNLSWEELIFNRHIKARQAVLYSPVIHYTGQKEGGKGRPKPFYSILHSLDEAMSLEKIRVINGELLYTPNADTKLQLENVDLTVSTNRLLAAKSSSMLGDAVDSLRFTKGSIRTRKLQASITNGNFKGDGTILEADEIQLNDVSKNTTIKAKGIRLEGMAFDENNEHISIDAVYWKEANVMILSSQPEKGSLSASPLSWQVNKVRGLNTQFSFESSLNKLSTFIYTLSTNAISKEAGKPVQLSGNIIMQGNKLSFSGRQFSLQCRDYSISEQAGSFLNEVYISNYARKDSITASIPQIRFSLDQSSLQKERPHFTDIALHNPAFYISTSTKEDVEDTATLVHKSLPGFTIDKLEIVHPFVSLKKYKANLLTSLVLNQYANNNSWLLNNISSSQDKPVAIGHLSIAINDALLKTGTGKTFSLAIRDIELGSSDTKINTQDADGIAWSSILDLLAFKQLTVSRPSKDSGVLSLYQFRAQHLSLQSDQSYTGWIRNSPRFELLVLQGNYINDKDHFRWHHAQYNHRLRSLSLDSFAYMPVQSRDAFIAAHPFQTDFFQLRTGNITIHNPDLHGVFKDSMTHISSLSISDPSIYVFRDKRPPFRHGIIKPLPVNMIRKLPLQLQVDSILLKNGLVQYDELSNKTGQTGAIRFSRLNALLTNVRSHDHQPTDSLHLQADAMLLDSIHIRLGLHESYTDSLASFYMTTRVSPADLTVLNKITGPLASVKIRSGYLDTLSLSAIGREHLSYGQMNMWYRKLNVQFLQADSSQRRHFVTRMITFLANSFVIRSRNERKTGIIYFERLRDRSVFNYMIKIFISGAGASIGVKNNKKQIKHYRRELRRQKLPDINPAMATGRSV